MYGTIIYTQPSCSSEKIGKKYNNMWEVDPARKLDRMLRNFSIRSIKDTKASKVKDKVRRVLCVTTNTPRASSRCKGS